MKSPLETRLSDDLSRIVADQPFMPDIEAIERRGRRLHRRSMAVRGGVGLGAAAGITAVALAVSAAQPGSTLAGSTLAGSTPAGSVPPGSVPPGSVPPHHHVAAPPAPSVTAIQARTVAAVSTASANSVLQAVVTTANVVIRSTTDAPDQIWNVMYETSAGQKKSELAMRQDPGVAGQVEAVAINYTTRTWGEMSLGEGSIPNPATDFLKVFKPNPNGRVRFVGTAVVDGQPAYVIDFTGLHDTRSTATDWISKATMLPIKSVSPGATVSYQWSGPGSVSPATLWPAVPAGFTRVAPLLALSRAKEGR